MIFSLNESAQTSEFSADVCIVGSGAAGISLALELATDGRSVLVLESVGPAPNETTDNLNIGENVGTIPLRLMETRTRAIGGATRLWYGQCIPLDSIDYQPRP